MTNCLQLSISVLAAGSPSEPDLSTSFVFSSSSLPSFSSSLSDRLSSITCPMEKRREMI